METTLINYEGHVTTITINRPEALNALSTQVLTEPNRTLGEVAANNSVHTLIPIGAGEESFVAGADIIEMKDKSVEEAAVHGKFSNEVFRKIETFRCPVIVTVNGFALGGGCELAMSYGIRVTSENTVFGQLEVGLEIAPSLDGTQRPVRLADTGTAKGMIYITRNIRAKRAYAIGLVNNVVPIEELMAAVMKMANGIVKDVSIAVTYGKKAINNGPRIDINGGITVEMEELSNCFVTEGQTYGITYLLEKTKDKRFSNK